MVEYIKTTFFLQKLFSHLSENRQLQLVTYSKNLQNLLNKSLINYKIFSGKYLIFETIGIGKIYNAYKDTLLFEGEYLNGKKNGKGKEYSDFASLIFEGEYLNGKRHGKGREFNNDGNIIFEGEYLNGKKNGKGKSYNNDGNIIFEGEYLSGEKWNWKRI